MPGVNVYHLMSEAAGLWSLWTAKYVLFLTDIEEQTRSIKYYL